MRVDDLRARWKGLMQGLPDPDAQSEAVFQRLIDAHAEPHRRYHGLDHLRALFELLDMHATQAGNRSELDMAVWWHDAVYDPTASDNEDQSADMAQRDLTRLGAPTDVIDRTHALILATKSHFTAPSMADGDLFLDADIAILGAPAHVYDAYAGNVRTEYGFVPDDAFAKGRSGFLRHALSMPRLFRTDIFEGEFSKQARVNMQRELDALGAA